MLLNNPLTRMILTGIAVIVLSVSAAQATAVLLVDSTGQLTGAQNVDVRGRLFDVTFVDGTCISVFDGCDALSDFDFSNSEIDAMSAATALLDQVFIDGPGTGQFDSRPDLTFGCSNSSICRTAIPYRLDTSRHPISTKTAINWNSPSRDQQLDLALTRSFDTNSNSQLVWARFSPTPPQIITVPEPMTFLLYALGLTVMTGVRRQRRIRL